MRRLVRLAVVAASIALYFWFLWWWPIGYTPFVRIGSEGSVQPDEYVPFVAVGVEG